jgi:hypothetical protein
LSRYGARARGPGCLILNYPLFFNWLLKRTKIVAASKVGVVTNNLLNCRLKRTKIAVFSATGFVGDGNFKITPIGEF